MAMLADHLVQLRARGIRPGLEPLRAALAAFGNPERELPALIVAGTNGKGSVVFYAEALLRVLGYHTARYISPPLSQFTERLAIDGVEVALAAWEAEHARVQAVLGDDHGLTEFEYTTLLALLLLRARQVTAAVLEAGMGGRLDAVNVVEPAVSVITSVGLDHQEFLGDDLAAIAGEKAGIMRPQTPALVGKLPEEAMAVVMARARELGCPLYRFGVQFSDWHDLKLEPPLLLNRAPVQADDALLAAKAVQLFHDGPVGMAAARQAWSALMIPGRGELIEREGKRYYFDTAHNPEAAMWLCAALRAIPGPKALLCGLMRDKDAAGYFTALRGVVTDTTAVTLPGERAASAGELAAIARQAGLVAHGQEGALAEVFQRWDAALPPEMLRVIAGSHTLVGPLRK
ncbi:MAG TPA: Mur ligase family protein [bacterium]|mgnify:CR=1 FL=1|nr:Mur ligase family protein [bacterium]